jgi:hypothetical protein
MIVTGSPGALARRLRELESLGFAAETRDVGLTATTRCAFDLQADVAEAVCPCNHHVELADRWQGPEDRLKLSGLLRGHAFDRREAVDGPRFDLNLFEADFEAEANESGWTINYVIHGWPAVQGQSADFPGDTLASAYDIETAVAAALKPLKEMGEAYDRYLERK